MSADARCLAFSSRHRFQSCWTLFLSELVLGALVIAGCQGNESNAAHAPSEESGVGGSSEGGAGGTLSAGGGAGSGGTFSGSGGNTTAGSGGITSAGGSAVGGGGGGGGVDDTLTFDFDSPPEDGYLRVQSSGSQACALRGDDTLECWGAGAATRPPRGTFSNFILAANGPGAELGCAISKEDGTVTCWSDADDVAKSPPAAVAFAQLSASSSQAVCGLRASDGLVECWGSLPPNDLPSIALDSFVEGGDLCGIREADSIVKCWNQKLSTVVDYSDLPLARLEPRTLTRVGGGALCAAKEGEQELECFAFATNPGPTVLTPENLMPADEPYHLLAGVTDHACGHHFDGTLTCFGEYESPPWRSGSAYFLPPPVAAVPHEDAVYWHVDASSYAAYAVRQNDGAVESWGARRGLPDNHLAFSSIFTSNETCGLLAESGEVACLFDHLLAGASRYPDPETGAFAQLALGQGVACGIRESGELLCWGDGYTAPPRPTGATYDSVALNSTGVCAVLSDTKGVECWALDGATLAAPSGSFSAVFASAASARPQPAGTTKTALSGTDPIVTQEPLVGGNPRFCGLLEDATASCWGCSEGDDSEACTPPNTGPYSMLAAGTNQVCGLLVADGSAECFPTGGSTPPAVAFDDIALGVDFGCGIRSSDKGLECWGAGAEEAVPPAGAFKDVSVGHQFGCAVETSSERVICWGAVERNMWIEP